jgi:hypothetical protein
MRSQDHLVDSIMQHILASIAIRVWNSLREILSVRSECGMLYVKLLVGAIAIVCQCKAVPMKEYIRTRCDVSTSHDDW